MNPGEKFGMMVVPNGRVEEVLNNPNLPTNKRPLFSLGTENPDDNFDSGQIAEFSRDSNLLVIEDLLKSRKNFDGDYNDIIFQLDGATAELPQLDEVINPARDWTQRTLGEKLNEYLNFSDLTFESGSFKVDDSGEVEINYLFDGGGYRGELAIFNLAGFSELNIRSHEDFVLEAARRAMSDSELGHVVIDDRSEGALFEKTLGEKNRNSGEYLGTKTFSMNPGDEFGLMLVPNGTVEEVFERPNIGWSKRPSLVMVAPGALTQETTVGLTPLTREDLSLPVPDGFEFVGAFELELYQVTLNDIKIKTAIIVEPCQCRSESA